MMINVNKVKIINEDRTIINSYHPAIEVHYEVYLYINFHKSESYISLKLLKD